MLFWACVGGHRQRAHTLLAMPAPGGHLKRQASQMTAADVPGLVGDLKKAAYEDKEKVVHLMDILAVQVDTNPRELVAAGAIKPLIELVKSGTDGSQVHAASALATIAAAKFEFQDKIIEAGAIQPLVALLHMGSNTANSFAAAAIASLSDQKRHRGEIVKAGACRPLVRLVREDVTVDTQLHASDAIADLSSENSEAQHIFHSAGAIPLLLQLLHSGKANNAAARALAKLLSPVGDTLDAPANAVRGPRVAPCPSPSCGACGTRSGAARSSPGLACVCAPRMVALLQGAPALGTCLAAAHAPPPLCATSPRSPHLMPCY